MLSVILELVSGLPHVGYESSICVLYMLIKQCGTWCRYPFWLDLVHVTGHVIGHIEYHHYCSRAWYPTFVQHNSMW